MEAHVAQGGGIALRQTGLLANTPHGVSQLAIEVILTSLAMIGLQKR
jgi:hypothetical protein